MTGLASADAALKAAADLITALENPSPEAPFAPVGETQLAALRTLANIFSSVIHEPTATKKPSSSIPKDSSPPRVVPETVPDTTSPRVDHHYPTRGRPSGKY
jgi:hypothetical protein